MVRIGSNNVIVMVVVLTLGLNTNLICVHINLKVGALEGLYHRTRT